MSTEQRVQERGDLRDGVLDDGDREVGAALAGDREPGEVLDGVAGDRDYHDAGEGLARCAARWIAGSGALMNQSETKAEATPATTSSASVGEPSESRGDDAAARGPSLGALLFGAGVERVGHDPGEVDAEQADRADAEIASTWRLATSCERERQASSTMMKTVTCSSVAVSFGRLLEAHHAVGRAPCADDEHDAEHEQGVGEDRADDRRLRDDQRPGLQGEDRRRTARGGSRASTATGP